MSQRLFYYFLFLMFTIVFGIAFIATALAGSWWTFFYLALFILSAN